MSSPDTAILPLILDSLVPPDTLKYSLSKSGCLPQAHWWPSQPLCLHSVGLVNPFTSFSPTYVSLDQITCPYLQSFLPWICVVLPPAAVLLPKTHFMDQLATVFTQLLLPWIPATSSLELDTHS